MSHQANDYTNDPYSKQKRCLYCGVTLWDSGGVYVPAIDNNDSWEQLAKEHHDNCEWIQTRAHQTNQPLYKDKEREKS